MTGISKTNSEVLTGARKSLDAYLSGAINLPALVGRLDTVRYGLVEFNQEWLKLYDEKWLALEEVNALALDDGQVTPLREHVDFSLTTIEAMRNLIDVQLGSGYSRCALPTEKEAVLYVSPVAEGDTNVVWNQGGAVHKVDSKIKFTDAVVFPCRSQLIVFHTISSNKSSFVGRVFDFSGNRLFDVPFPDLGKGCSHVSCSYSWSSEINNGVKIVFVTDSVSYRDFWCDYHLDKRKYGASNEAR